jgi:putative ABC transport system substrate-binding protein
MRRREFIGLVGGAVASPFASPLATRAQQPAKPRRLAFVHSGIAADHLTEKAGPFWVRRFFETLRGLGDVEGSNLVIERFSAEGRLDRFAALAAEVVSWKPDVIVSNLNDLVKALMAATAAIPIVMIAGDPIAGGLVKNLARPGGNVTGVSVNAGIEIYAKRLQILKEAVPSLAKLDQLVSGEWDDGGWASLDEAWRRLGVNITRISMPVVDDAQLQRTFAEMAQQKVDAFIVDEGGSFLAQRGSVVELAKKYRLPAIYPYRDYVEEGGLMALAPDIGELAERMANDVHQLFNGAKAGDIPIYQPSKFQMIINLKTAKTIGLDIPVALVARADEVIE